MVKYTIFKTKWGYFGLAATNNGLLRTCLPPRLAPVASFCEAKRRGQRGPEREKIKSQLLRYFPSAQYDISLFESAQKRIAAYFEGDCVNFSNIPVALPGLSVFAKQVLTACRDIEFGQTVTYGRLAELAGSPAAARAVGTTLSKNPLPLIIPCHRVVCANGSLGGFSAFGGIGSKKRLLELEASYRAASVSARSS